MEWMIGFMQQLAVIAVMAAFLELLLPNGEMQKFIRFFMGLLILVAFMSSFGKWQQTEWDFSAMAEMEQQTPSTEEILAAGKELDNTATEMAKQQMGIDLAAQITALVRLIDGVDQVSVAVSVAPENPLAYEKVNITLWITDIEKIKKVQEDVYRMMAAFYQLPEEKIECHIKEVTVNGNE